MSALQLPRIGYTLGDQAGIGPEIMQRALHELKSQTARFVPVRPVDRLSSPPKRLGSNLNVRLRLCAVER